MRLTTVLMLALALFLGACNEDTPKTADTPSATDAQDKEKSVEETAKTSGGTPLPDQNAKFSYIIGVNIGSNFKQDDMNLALELVLEGMNDALNEAVTLSDEEMMKLGQEFNQALQQKRTARIEQEKVINQEEANQFLAANKDKEGIITLDSGMQYKVLTTGEGDKKPAAADRVKVHYTGRLIDGTEFDSSVKRGQPATFGCNQVIKGWTEALLLMSPGDKWQLFIPPDLAYGARSQGKIPANSLLIFDVELLEIL